MSKYCYVIIANQTEYWNDYEGKRMLTETGSLLNGLLTEVSLRNYGPSVAAFKGIRQKIRTERKEGFLGIHYTSNYYVDDPVCIICEDKGEYLEDVITGKKFTSVGRNGVTNKPDRRVLAKPLDEIPGSKVSEILKSLDDETLQKYAEGIRYLENAIFFGYDRDIERMRNEEIKSKNNDAFIKSFRNRYGK